MDEGVLWLSDQRSMPGRVNKQVRKLIEFTSIPQNADYTVNEAFFIREK